jgi:hypothetical protein
VLASQGRRQNSKSHKGLRSIHQLLSPTDLLAAEKTDLEKVIVAAPMPTVSEVPTCQSVCGEIDVRS